jgi:hypothetical protein
MSQSLLYSWSDDDAAKDLLDPFHLWTLLLTLTTTMDDPKKLIWLPFQDVPVCGK